ncbi:MAG: hypothetical protein LBJ83_00860 [Oscillospiraceae bacterium]|nr:hypothetical protein [Oscillospiraceae bacterium]
MRALAAEPECSNWKDVIYISDNGDLLIGQELRPANELGTVIENFVSKGSPDEVKRV